MPHYKRGYLRRVNSGGSGRRRFRYSNIRSAKTDVVIAATESVLWVRPGAQYIQIGEGNAANV